MKVNGIQSSFSYYTPDTNGTKNTENQLQNENALRKDKELLKQQLGKIEKNMNMSEKDRNKQTQKLDDKISHLDEQLANQQLEGRKLQQKERQEEMREQMEEVQERQEERRQEVLAKIAGSEGQMQQVEAYQSVYGQKQNEISTENGEIQADDFRGMPVEQKREKLHQKEENLSDIAAGMGKASAKVHEVLQNSKPGTGKGQDVPEQRPNGDMLIKATSWMKQRESHLDVKF